MTRRGRRLLAALTAGSLLMAGCTTGGGAKRSEQAAPATPLPDIGGGSDQTVATGNTDADFDAPDAPDAPPVADIGAAAKPDLGFRPKGDGFPFPNYSNAGKPTNLTAADMRETFGDVVCSDPKKCHLTPLAAGWMKKWNADMAGGHCYGFSVASLLFYKNKLKPKSYGAASIGKLELPDNDTLQRELAQRWLAQKFPAVREKILYGTPNQVLDQLTTYLSAGAKAPETYTIAIFNPPGTGGHAITPYAISDKGKGKVAVLVYDNNWPGKVRQILFDRNANKWSYYAALNPGVPAASYYGDEKNPRIFLFPTNPGLGKQPCFFCDPKYGANGVGSADTASDDTAFGTVTLSDSIGADHPRLLLTAPDGKRTGWVDGKLVNEIPGVEIQAPLLDDTWTHQPEPEYRVPADLSLTVTVDRSAVNGPTTAAEVNYLAPGKHVAVGNLDLAPGQRDVLTIPAGGAELSYAASAARSPVFTLGADNADGADYAFTVGAKGLPAGGAVSLGLAADRLALDTTAAGAPLAIDLGMIRQDTGDPLSFAYQKLPLDRSLAGILYSGWTRDGDAIPFELTKNGNTLRGSLSDDGSGPTPVSGGGTASPAPGQAQPGGDPAGAAPGPQWNRWQKNSYALRIPLPGGNEIVVDLETQHPYSQAAARPGRAVSLR